MKLKNLSINPGGLFIVLILFIANWIIGLLFLLFCLGCIWLSYWYYTKIATTNHLLYTAGYIPAKSKGKFHPVLKIGERKQKIVMVFKHITFNNYEDAIQEAIPSARLMNEWEESKKNKPRLTI